MATVKDDSYYEIGRTHIKCEDYAISGKINEQISFAIVCDGCSGTDDKYCVSTGARIMAHVAKSVISKFYESFTSLRDIDEVGNKNAIKQLMLHNLKISLTSMNLSSNVLDCTLNICLMDNDNNGVNFLFGDGCVFWSDKESSYLSVYEYENGAPYYLSYSINSARDEIYRKQNTKVVESIYMIVNDMIDGGKKVAPVDTRIHDIEIEPKFELCNIMASMTDGFLTYLNNNNEFIPIEKVLDECLDFRNINENFLVRRMIRLKKNNEKDNIIHKDDIGISVLICDE